MTKNETIREFQMRCLRTAHSVSTHMRPSNELDLFFFPDETLQYSRMYFDLTLVNTSRAEESSFGRPEKIYLFCEFSLRSSETIRSMQKFPLVIVCNDNAATATVSCTDSRAQTFGCYLFEVCLLLLVRFTDTAYLFNAFSFGCAFLSIVIVATTPALSFKWP